MEDLLAQPGDRSAGTLPESPHVGLPQPVPVSCRKAASAPPRPCPNKGPLSGVPQVSGQPSCLEALHDVSCSLHPVEGSGLI